MVCNAKQAAFQSAELDLCPGLDRALHHDGSGRVAGAAVGAGVGAVVGDRIDNSHRGAYGSQPVETCTLVDDWRTVERGYLVTYRYNGREYTTTLPYHPGKKLQVRVAVAPETDYNVSQIDDYRYDDGRHPGWDSPRGYGR